jgi:hypothetical protein
MKLTKDNLRRMARKSHEINLLILNLLLLLTSCNGDDEKEELSAPSLSFLFTTDVRVSGEVIPLPEMVNVLSYPVGRETDWMLQTIPIDKNGLGGIKRLINDKWHIKYWSTFPENLLSFNRDDNSISVRRANGYLVEPVPFYAGVSEFDYVQGKIVPLNLKPQTSILTIALVKSDATNLPQTINGELSGIVSKRTFGMQDMRISEQGVGSIPLLFTLSSYSPPTYVASCRLLGISNTQKCELTLPDDGAFPTKVNLTAKLVEFNSLAIDHTLCFVHIHKDMTVEAIIKVIDWKDREYEYQWMWNMSM